MSSLQTMDPVISRTVQVNCRLSITLAAVFAFPLSLFLLWLYRRAVLRSMNTRSPRPPTRAPDSARVGAVPTLFLPCWSLLPSLRTHPRRPKWRGGTLYWQATRRPWHAAAVYGAAGCCLRL